VSLKNRPKMSQVWLATALTYIPNFYILAYGISRHSKINFLNYLAFTYFIMLWTEMTRFPCQCYSISTRVAQAEVWPHHCWRSGSFTLATSAAGGVQGQFIGLQVPPSCSSIISGWYVHSCLSNRRPMLPLLCNTWRPGSSTNQIGNIRKKKGSSVSGPLLWHSLPPTDRDVSLTLTQFCER